MEEKSILKEKLIEEEKVDVPVLEHKPINISSEGQKNEEELQKIAPVKEDTALKTKSVSKKWLMALLFVAVNLLAITLTAVIEFIGDEHPINISKVWGTFMENWMWGLGAIALVIVAICSEASKRFFFLKNTLKKNMPLTSLSSAIICKYYDNITPLGAGGQPFEIYYLRKQGIPIGIASGVPLVSYSLSKIAYVLVSLTSICICGFGEVSNFIQVVCLVGLIVNLLMPVAIISFALRPNFSSAVARWIAKAGKKLRLIKDEKAFYNKMTGSFIEYADCIKYFLKKSKLNILIGFLSSVVYYLALYSIPYFTIRMSGNHNIAWGEMFTYCVICYATVTLLPTPGGAGGAELSFRSIFSNYLSGGLLFWGMLSWRILSYYSFIIFGLIIIIIQQVTKFTKKVITEDIHGHGAKKVKEPEIEEEDELEPYSPVPPTFKTEDADINTAEPLSVVEATLEPETEEIVEDIDIAIENAEAVVEFTAVIESKSSVKITEEHIELSEKSEKMEDDCTHQITFDELTNANGNENHDTYAENNIQTEETETKEVSEGLSEVAPAKDTLNSETDNETDDKKD